jgi:type I restriction enzyme S subunit
VRARLGWKGLKADEYVDAGYIFLSTPNLKEEKIDFENVNYINQFRYDESPEIKLTVGDVLLAKDGSTLGTVNVVRNLPNEATVNGSIAVITPKNNVNSVYLMYLIKSSYIQNIIRCLKDGSGVPHLFQRDINKIYITRPPLPEQQEIADYLEAKCSEIDATIQKRELAIEKLTAYKQSLIYECVTGKKEVLG